MSIKQRIAAIWSAATGDLRNEQDTANSRIRELERFVDMLDEQVAEAERRALSASETASKALLERNEARTFFQRASDEVVRVEIQLRYAKDKIARLTPSPR